MLAFITILLATTVAASPALLSACPGHARVYSALTSYSSASEFCSTWLGISSVSATVSITLTSSTIITTTLSRGTVISTAPAGTSTLIAASTRTTTITSTITSTISNTASTNTVIVTITTANVAACALSTGAAKIKRDTSSTAPTIPTNLPGFNAVQLSAGCSCLSLSINTVTTTVTAQTTVTATRTSTVAATTTTTTLVNSVTQVSIIVRTVTSLLTLSTTTGLATAITSTRTTTVAYSTPSSFFIKGSNGLYASLAEYSGGGVYLDYSNSSEADSFHFNSTNQLVVTTPGSQYLGYYGVGTPTVENDSTDWYQIEFTKSGVDDDRTTLCCGVTITGTLTCDYGELFGYCSGGTLFEGSPEAPVDDYYYQELTCHAVTLNVVTK